MVIKNKFLILTTLLLVFSFFFSINFVSATDTATPTDGQITFSIREDTYFIFNITVNNTNINTGSPGNISIVNITIPSSFTFVINSNGTNSSHISNFTNNGRDLIWTNNSMLISGGVNSSYFWFNASAANPGYYNITVTTYNGTGIQGGPINITVQVNDTTAPIITLISPVDGATNQNPSLDFVFNVSDVSPVNCSLIVNGKIWSYLNTTVNIIGGNNTFSNTTYLAYNTWWVNCTDYLNATGYGNNTGNSTIFSFSLVSFQFNGTVKDESGNMINNSIINVSIRDQNTWNVVGYASTTSNATGKFNISLVSNNSWIYSPVITKRNSTYNYTELISKTIPPFPSSMMSFLAGTTFYLTPAGTINITATNSTTGASRALFQYEVKDTKLGYPIASDHSSYASEVILSVPKNRNYSIMIYPFQSMPLSFEWTDFSSTESYGLNGTSAVNLSNYNVTTKTLHKQFNVSSTLVRVYGNAMSIIGNVSPINFSNFTVIPFIVESGNMVHATYGDMPINMSRAWGEDETYLLTGTYNLTIPGPAENLKVLLFATALGNDSIIYGGFRNISLTYGQSPQSINFTLYKLLGYNSTYTRDNLQGGSLDIQTAMQNFTIVNATNEALGSVSAHAEITVDYTLYGANEFTWTTDVAQSSSTANFGIPMINETGFKAMNVFVSGGPSGGNGQYAPLKLNKRTPAEIKSNSNVTVRTFNPQALDGTTGSSINIVLYTSSATCDVPNPATGCNVTPINQNMATFNPMGAVMGGGKLSFRMGIGSVLVHYVNVDLLASGPPDALFEDNNDITESASSGSFGKLMRFGSAGPTIYDYVLVSMPYTEGSTSVTGLNENKDINLSISTFYGENADGSMNWDNPIWSSANGTTASALAGNYSHYSTYASAWQTLMTPSNCTRTESSLSATTPCYIDTTNNTIWVRLPHFSGTKPGTTGNVITATTTTPGGSSPGTSTSDWLKTTILTDTQFKNGFTTELGVKHRARVRVNSIYHYVGVKKLTSTIAGIEVSSSAQSADLTIGAEKKFDVTNDGYYDISVKLNSITNNKASIAIKSINEKIITTTTSTNTTTSTTEPSATAPSEETKEKISSKTLWIIAIVIAILIIAGLGYYFFFYKKKKNFYIVYKRGLKK